MSTVTIVPAHLIACERVMNFSLFSALRSAKYPSGTKFTCAAGIKTWGNAFEPNRPAMFYFPAQLKMISSEGCNRDAKTLFYTKILNTQDHWEITRVDLDKGGLQTAVLPGPFRRASAEVSPDGGLISYRSDETGTFEIYVQTYPAMDKKIAASVGGGDYPVWSADGKELLYRSGDRVMAVEVTRQPTLRASPPRELFRGTYVNPVNTGRQYHVASDGRFIMLKRGINEAAPVQPKIVLDVNWLEALRGR